MKRYSLIPLLVFLLWACTSNDAQDEFEREAYQAASGYTQTDAQGQVLELDEDDWRISPLYQGLVNINPPFPNPANVGSPINFEITILGIQSVPGLDVQIRYPNNQWNNLYRSFDNPLPTGATAFQIDPIQLGEFGTVESARGLHRIYFFDFNQRLISYGDILVE